MIGWIILIAVVAIFTIVMLALWHEVTRPLNDTDRWCAQVDRDLDDAEHDKDGYRLSASEVLDTQRGNPRGVGRQDWPS